jgi:Na+/proline symporter
MLLGHWLGWLALAALLLALGNYLARKGKNQILKHLLKGKHHRWIGMGMVILACLHSVLGLATLLGAGCGFAALAAVLLSGLCCLLVTLFVAITYWQRKKLPKHWFKLHRIGAVLLLPLVLVHLLMRQLLR